MPTAFDAGQSVVLHARVRSHCSYPIAATAITPTNKLMADSLHPLQEAMLTCYPNHETKSAHQN
jgi:hypothetical protein